MSIKQWEDELMSKSSLQLEPMPSKKAHRMGSDT